MLCIDYVKDEPLGGRIEIDYAKCTRCGTCAKKTVVWQ
ncbi:4Fe-4S binding protein [Thermoanaerobacterium saccharolyticum]